MRIMIVGQYNWDLEAVFTFCSFLIGESRPRWVRRWIVYSGGSWVARKSELMVACRLNDCL